MARLRTSTIVLAAALTAWFALDFVGWPRLVDREPLVSLAGLMLVLMLAFIAGGVLRVRYLAIPYLLALGIWAALQWQTHWSSYVLAASPEKLKWYSRVFGEHSHLLPDRVGHTTPDAYHTILAALILANLLAACRDVSARSRFADQIASTGEAQDARN